MKKIITGILLMAVMPLRSLACDICGCGPGNNYIGILPEFSKHIFGVRYRHNAMLTHLGVGGTHTYLTTQETYRTVEAWGGWNIGDNFRIMATIPYSFNNKVSQEETGKKEGVGDISTFAFYQVLNHRESTHNSRLLVQSLWFGAGIKWASGKYNPADRTAGINNANLFQLGTGSTDFNLNLMYDVRLQDAGINLVSNYKINTGNRYNYQYGNKWNSNLQAYYKFRVAKKNVLSPNIGVQYEQSVKDDDAGIQVAASGGRIFLGTVGLETAFSRFAVGANYQTPFSQRLGSGMVNANDRLMVHLAMAL